MIKKSRKKTQIPEKTCNCSPCTLSEPHPEGILLHDWKSFLNIHSFKIINAFFSSPSLSYGRTLIKARFIRNASLNRNIRSTLLSFLITVPTGFSCSKSINFQPKHFKYFALCKTATQRFSFHAIKYLIIHQYFPIWFYDIWKLIFNIRSNYAKQEFQKQNKLEKTSCLALKIRFHPKNYQIHRLSILGFRKL